jgi:hypothetical protein
MSTARRGTHAVEPFGRSARYIRSHVRPAARRRLSTRKTNRLPSGFRLVTDDARPLGGRAGHTRNEPRRARTPNGPEGGRRPLSLRPALEIWGSSAGARLCDAARSRRSGTAHDVRTATSATAATRGMRRIELRAYSAPAGSPAAGSTLSAGGGSPSSMTARSGDEHTGQAAVSSSAKYTVRLQVGQCAVTVTYLFTHGRAEGSNRRVPPTFAAGLPRELTGSPFHTLARGSSDRGKGPARALRRRSGRLGRLSHTGGCIRTLLRRLR